MTMRGARRASVSRSTGARPRRGGFTITASTSASRASSLDASAVRTSSSSDCAFAASRARSAAGGYDAVLWALAAIGFVSLVSFYLAVKR